MGSLAEILSQVEDTTKARSVQSETAVSNMEKTEISDAEHHALFLAWINRISNTLTSEKGSDENSLPTVAEQDAMNANPVNAGSVNTLKMDFEQDSDFATVLNAPLNGQSDNNGGTGDKNGTATPSDN